MSIAEVEAEGFLSEREVGILASLGVDEDAAQRAQCLADEVREFLARRVGADVTQHELALCLAMANLASGSGSKGSEIHEKVTEYFNLVADLTVVARIRRMCVV